MCLKDNIPALFRGDKPYQSCMTFDPWLPQGSYNSNLCMELDHIRRRRCCLIVVLVYRGSVNGVNEIKQKTNMAGWSPVQVLRFVKMKLVLCFNVKDMNLLSNLQLMNYCNLLWDNVCRHMTSGICSCMLCLTHRLNGAWSWCVWCPTTHTRGWCHVYRDTSVQMQRRDM